MLCSVVIATRNKSPYLDRTLSSIFAQHPACIYEVVVVDDGSTDDTAAVCQRYPVVYCKVENEQYRSPGIARNIGYRLAKGDIVIAQSDEVLHESPEVIDSLCARLTEGTFALASVKNVDRWGNLMSWYSHPVHCARNLFFLGAVYRKDIYAIGGNDEEFDQGGYEDNWFSDCLMGGLGLRAVYDDGIVGAHQNHPPAPLRFRRWTDDDPMKKLYERKTDEIPTLGYRLKPWTYV